MSWLHKQLLIASAALLVSIVIFEFTSIDLLIQDSLFDFSAGNWFWDKNEPVSRFFLYDAIKTLFIMSALALAIFLAFFKKHRMFQSYRRGLLIVCVSMFVVPGVANLAKAVTNVPCPSDLMRYEGDYPYVTLFSPYPESFVQERNIRCYPAGHASGGFALLSLFFLFHKPGSRKLAVVFALTLAWTVGTYKMAIGDHFLGHTVVMMMLAWLLILIITRLIHPEYAPQDYSD